MCLRVCVKLLGGCCLNRCLVRLVAYVFVCVCVCACLCVVLCVIACVCVFWFAGCFACDKFVPLLFDVCVAWLCVFVLLLVCVRYFCVCGRLRVLRVCVRCAWLFAF